MSELIIKYDILHKGETPFVFELKIDQDSMELIHEEGGNLPEWAELDFAKCGHCPLNSAEHKHCPLAKNLTGVLRSFSEITSYDEVHLKVTTKERTIIQETSAQRAISSLMGLLIATSGCPHTHFFKPMARFHSPMAEEEETIFRSTGNYLLAQYFLKKAGKPADFNLKGLETIYRDIEKLNLKIVDRIRAACHEDSTVNAIVILDFFAKMLPDMIEDSLDFIKYMYQPYLDQESAAAEAVKSSS